MDDLQGRTYAKRSELKPGDKVQVDGDFTCMDEGSIFEVKRRADGQLYIDCKSESGHNLIGPLADDHDSLVGIYPVK